MVGFGLDNTNTMIGDNNGVVGCLWRDLLLFIVANVCIAHLFQLTNKNAYEQYRHLIEFDILVKKVDKFFSKVPKKILDLQKWHALQSRNYHKLLNIFDIRWLLKTNSVNSLRCNLLTCSFRYTERYEE